MEHTAYGCKALCKGASKDGDGGGALDVVRELLSHVPGGIDVNAKDSKGRSAFFWASSADHVSVMNKLTKDKKVGVKGVAGAAALIYAGFKDHIDTVCKLLNHARVDTDVKHFGGSTAYNIACSLQMTAIAQCLEEHANCTYPACFR